MTGFGVADGLVGGGRLHVELRTVNHRHFNAQLRLPGMFQGLEGALRERLRARIERGHVNLSVRWIEEPAGPQTTVRVDVERARAILAAVEKLRNALHLAATVDAAFLARQPEVLRFDAGDEPPTVPEADVLALVDRAVDGALAMRAQEGDALARDLNARLDQLSAGLARVQARAPERLTAERGRLRQAISELLDGREVDPDRLAQELAYTAERLDITEEIVRLETHLTAAREVLVGDAPGGRRLGFLAQEMLREINTIGSKANDATIAHAVIAMKEELERFREQLENLE
ncbi:MAG: YicC family protein [Gemmatimonadota bacterium]|nr:YicC family protein [Gemmatimonadota bacterium]